MMLFGRGAWNCFDGFRYFGYYHGIGMIGFLILAVVVFMIFKKSKHKSEDDDILHSLKMKYINGEITEEEYLSKKNILSKK